MRARWSSRSRWSSLWSVGAQARQRSRPSHTLRARSLEMTTIQPTRDPLVATAVEGPWGPTCIAASEQGADAIGELATLSLDLEDRPAWDRAVLDAVRAIPRGETRSYGDIARAIGRPGAAPAVGGAVGRHPIGLVIPRHRVIAGDGTLGGYGGGWWGDRDRLLDLKAELLAREGVQLRRSRSGV